MEIILTKSVRKLGKVGDIVNVRSGHGRNYLLPQNLAIRATKENIAEFSSIKKDLEKKNQENMSAAKKAAASLTGKHITFVVQSSADGKLFGSISAKGIAAELSKMTDFAVSYEHVMLDNPIKFNGVYEVKTNLHPEVEAEVLVVIAKSEEEAATALQDYHEEKKAPSKEGEENLPQESVAPEEAAE